MSGHRLDFSYCVCTQPDNQTTYMDTLVLQPEDLRRWEVLSTCQQSFLEEVRLVCFLEKRVDGLAKWALVVKTSDKVYTVGDTPAWALDRETRGVSGPLEIAELSGRGVVGLAGGCKHCLVLTRSGEVMSWGNNSHGQLGLASRESIKVPVRLPGLTKVTSVACGLGFSLALTKDKVYAWGNSGRGECGVEGGDVLIPSRVEFPAGVTPVSIACGWRHAAAVGCDGKVYCWGWNDWGQLGRGGVDKDSHSDPRPVELFSAASQACCAGGRTLASTADGQVWAWGSNKGGRLGVGRSERKVPSPSLVKGLPSVRSITTVLTSSYHLARTDSVVYIWEDLNGDVVSQPRAVGSVAEALANRATPTMCVRRGLTCLNLSVQFKISEHPDVIVDLGGSRVFCHSAILRRASPLLSRMLTGAQYRGGKRVLRLEGYRPASYRAFLRYLHTRRLHCEGQEELPELYEISRMFEVDVLKRKVVEAVRRRLSPSNALHFFRAAVGSSALELQELTTKFIVRHFTEVGKTKSFQSLEDIHIAKFTRLYFNSN